MTESIFNKPELNNTKKLPATLHVLTILTLIGSAVGFLFLIYSFFTAKTNLEKIEDMMNSSNFDELPGFVRKMFNPEMLELARKQVENKVPILLIGIISMALCVLGALVMRKLKSTGYFIYLIGELLPIVGNLIFLGVGVYIGFGGVFSLLFPLLFIILYTLQKKHLTQ